MNGGNFSELPADVVSKNREKGYIGIHIEQGVPVLDRDLNLLHDLIRESVREVIAQFIGDGVADGRTAFQIIPVQPPANDFVIRSGGSCLLNGWEVWIPENKEYKYSDQAVLEAPDVLGLTVPNDDEERTDIVYLDVWPTEITSKEDKDLGNEKDIGIPTGTRVKLNWRVQVAEGKPLPEPTEESHRYYPLAELSRSGQAITEEMITDLREPRLTVSTIEQRLRAVEFHLFGPKFVRRAIDGKELEFKPPKLGVGEPLDIFGSNLDPEKLTVKFGKVRADRSTFETTPEGIRVKVPVSGWRTGQNEVHITLSNQFGSSTSEDIFTIVVGG